MKATLISLILYLFSTVMMAQCVPDPRYTAPGIYPDSATNLPPAYVGSPYSEVITFVVPPDTNLPPKVTIDSVVLTGFAGFPPGFTYTCNTSSCSWQGGTSGCVAITGTASAGDEGTYPLLGYVESFAGGLPFPVRDTVTYLRINVLATFGIDDKHASGISGLQNYPNPADRQTEVVMHAHGKMVAMLEVHDIIGNRIYSRKLDLYPGANRFGIDTRQFRQGVYLYTVQSATGTVSKRMIVMH